MFKDQGVIYSFPTLQYDFKKKISQAQRGHMMQFKIEKAGTIRKKLSTLMISPKAAF